MHVKRNEENEKQQQQHQQTAKYREVTKENKNKQQE